MIVAGASAYSRIIDFSAHGRHRESGGRAFLRRYGAHRGTRGWGMHPSPVPARRFRIHDHAQDAARAARRVGACKTQFAKELDRITFPGTQARAADAYHRRQGRMPEGSGRSGIHEYAKQIVANARKLAAEISKAGFRIAPGARNNHLFLIDLYSRGVTGKDAQPALDRAGITVNKNSIPSIPRRR